MTSKSLPLFDTREEAHAQVQRSKRATYARILDYAEECGLRGFTAHEVAVDFGCSHNHCAPRISELVRAGELIVTGRRRPTRFGCLARVILAARFAQQPYADPPAAVVEESLFGDASPTSEYPD